VVLVKREEGFFLVMLVCQDNGVERMVFESCRRIVEKVNVGVAHMFKFREAQCLLGDCLAYNILLCRREAVREEGNKLDH